MRSAEKMTAAGAALAGLGVLAGIALGSSGSTPSLPAQRPQPVEVRTEVIRKTVNVYRRAKPRPDAAGTAGSSGVRVAAAAAPSTRTSGAGSAPAAVPTTRTSGAAGGGSAGSTPVSTRASGGGSSSGGGGVRTRSSGGEGERGDGGGGGD